MLGEIMSNTACFSNVTGGVPALVDLLRTDSEDLQSVSASVLCNISEHEAIRLALTESNAGPILIHLLSSPVDEIQSRASIVLSDLVSLMVFLDILFPLL